MAESDTEGDPSLLSLLDVLSCGLGAAVFLCVIFVASHSARERRAFATGGMVATFQVTNADALLNILVTPPGATKPIELDLRNLRDGTVWVWPPGRVEDPAERSATTDHRFRVVVYGFSQSGTIQSQTHVAFFYDLEVGEWTIGARYFNRRGDPTGWSGEDALGKAIGLTGRLVVADERAVEPQDAQFPPLELGDAVFFKPVILSSSRAQ